MKTDLCEPYKSLTIYKVIRKISEDSNQDQKYIFVGHIEDKNIKGILKKIEEFGYQKLTKLEHKKLQRHISNYQTRFGEIYPQRTKFIYTHILDTNSINTIKIKIHKYLSNKKEILLPRDQHLWVQQNNIKYSILVEFINYVFRGDEQIKTSLLYQRLQEILMKKSNEEIDDLVMSLFSKKYGSNQKTSTFSQKNG